MTLFFSCFLCQITCNCVQRVYNFFWQDAAEPTTQEELERRLKKLEKVAFPFGSTKTNNSFTVYICNPFFLLIIFKYKHYELFSSSTVHENCGSKVSVEEILI